MELDALLCLSEGAVRVSKPGHRWETVHRSQVLFSLRSVRDIIQPTSAWRIHRRPPMPPCDLANHGGVDGRGSRPELAAALIASEMKELDFPTA